MGAALQDRPEGLGEGWKVGRLDGATHSNLPTFQQFPMSSRAPLQPSQRALQGVASGQFVRPSRHHVVERHRDIGAQRPLDLRGALGRERAAAAVDVALELDARLIHAAEPLEREHLEASRVGEQRTVPAHEAVQPPELLHDVLPRTHVQVVGVREDHGCAGGAEVVGREGAHRALRADRHEERRLDRPVGQGEGAGAGGAGGRVEREFEQALRVHRITIASP